MKLQEVREKIASGESKQLDCPPIPWSGFDDRRGEFSRQGNWLVLLNLLQLRHYLKQWWNNPLPVLRWLYNSRLVPALPAEWTTLRDTAKIQGF